MRLGSSLAWALVLVCACFAEARGETFQKTDSGVLVPVGNTNVELAVATPTAFRISISSDARTAPLESTFLAKSIQPVWQLVQAGPMIGVKSEAGEIDINSTTGEWTLKNAQGKIVIPPSPLGKLSLNQANNPAVDFPVTGTPGLPLKVYGCGNGPASLQQTEAHSRLADGTAIIPYYWAPQGYAALAVTENDNVPASWDRTADSFSLTWHFPGKSADLYLMPTDSLMAATLAYDQLTGFPPVPPLWTMGYMQSRWGWKNRAYIEDTLHQFRSRHIPVDAFIYDFEWYTSHPDYEVPPQGEANFTDFGWNPALFPDPANQIPAYEAEGVRFIGIRKPRIGNSDTLKTMRQNGWLLDAPGGTNYQTRDLKFADPNLRAWYADQSQSLLKNHISGWWDDEGEGAFTTYFYWNTAEQQAFDQAKLDQRLWTIDRAFSPGLQRLGAAAWTGDIEASWAQLERAPTDLLNWSVAGMPYAACDIGGFWNPTTPTLLSRWMEAGVFFPVMRAHSEIKMVPHFPWLFGPAALDAITKAIDLRYRFIPYNYSLAYEAHETGEPMMRPMIMEFPDDPKVSNLSDQWMVGPGLLAAPILKNTSHRDVYLPGGRWYRLDTNKRLEGAQTIHVSAALDEIPVYVLEGTILTLGPVVQNTEQLPGGPLDLQIYPGKDATFALVEDDGETNDYLQGAFRRTTFHWDDAARKLSWTIEGPYAGANRFLKMTASLFDVAKDGGKKQQDASLEMPGTLTFAH